MDRGGCGADATTDVWTAGFLLVASPSTWLLSSGGLDYETVMVLVFAGLAGEDGGAPLRWGRWI